MRYLLSAAKAKTIAPGNGSFLRPFGTESSLVPSHDKRVVASKKFHRDTSISSTVRIVP